MQKHKSVLSSTEGRITMVYFINSEEEKHKIVSYFEASYKYCTCIKMLDKVYFDIEIVGC